MTIENIKSSIINYFVNISAVSEVFLCGSFAKGNAHDASDVDLLIVVNGSKAGLNYSVWSEELEEILGRKVDMMIYPGDQYKGPNFAFYNRLKRTEILLFKNTEINAPE